MLSMNARDGIMEVGGGTCHGCLCLQRFYEQQTTVRNRQRLLHIGSGIFDSTIVVWEMVTTDRRKY